MARSEGSGPSQRGSGVVNELRATGAGLAGGAEAGAERWPLGRKELLLIFAFWTFVALLAAANAALDPRGRALQPVMPAAPVALAFAEAYLWAALTPLIFWTTSRFRLERSNWVSRVLLFVGVGVAIAIFVEVVIGYLRFEVRFIPRRPFPTLDPLVAVTRLFFLNELIVYIAILAAGFARDYFLRFRARQEEAMRLQAHAAQLQAQLAEARLEALRMQINPHFLFNTLHAVSTLVERDPRGVRRMIARLSELLRYTLEGAGEQEVPLQQELDFLERYLEIMQIRFQGRLECETRVEPGIREALVPNLILQPLVENAAKHGVDKLEGGGRIEVRAWREGDRLVLSVRDNGPGLTDPSAERSGQAVPGVADGGLGLQNTRARLAELYGADQRLTLRPAEGGGMIAEIELPYHTRADLHAPGYVTSEAEPDHEHLRGGARP